MFHFSLLLLQQANPSAEINHPSDGILNIFNDEDLQLMDMAVNEGKFYEGKTQCLIS